MITDRQLRDLTNDICDSFGYNKNVIYEVKWSNRLTSAGGNCGKRRRCGKVDYRIHISTPWVSINGEELLMQILCHEIIHTRYFNHGYFFQQELVRLGNLRYAYLYGYEHRVGSTNVVVDLDIHKCYAILERRRGW